MTFQDLLSSDLARFFNADEFAETISYNGSNVPAIFAYSENPDDVGDATQAVAEIYVKTSDVAAPNYRDVVIIGATTWYVRRIKEGAGYTWLLELYRNERPIL